MPSRIGWWSKKQEHGRPGHVAKSKVARILMNVPQTRSLISSLGTNEAIVSAFFRSGIRQASLSLEKRDLASRNVQTP